MMAFLPDMLPCYWIQGICQLCVDKSLVDNGFFCHSSENRNLGIIKQNLDSPLLLPEEGYRIREAGWWERGNDRGVDAYSSDFF